MRQLLPEPLPEVDVAARYGTLAERNRPTGRPWVAVSMIASVDGATALDGRSGGLGGPGDKEVFRAMRAAADVVLVGSATVAAEGYRPPARAGLLVAVVSGRGSVDPSSALFTSGAGLLVTTVDAPDLGVPTLRAGRGTEVDLAGALAQLSADVVVCEGGPHLNGQVLAADLADELCLTIAPMLVGGTSARVAVGPVPARRSMMRLAHLLTDDEHMLYARYVRAGTTS